MQKFGIAISFFIKKNMMRYHWAKQFPSTYSNWNDDFIIVLIRLIIIINKQSFVSNHVSNKQICLWLELNESNIWILTTDGVQTTKHAAEHANVNKWYEPR